MTEERPDGWIEPTMEEPETGDDDEEQEAEEAETPTPEPEPEPVSEAQAEAILKSLEREAVRHHREVVKRAGPMYADLTPCPACTGMPGTPGFIVTQLPPDQEEARRQIVAQALGASAEPVYQADPERETCPTCQGLGKLTTGSRVPNQDALPCRVCNGQGWKQKLTPVQPVVPVPAPGTNVAGVTEDAWGRPLGHPHYAMAPASVGV